MSALATAIKNWTDAVIKMGKAGVPTKDLAGNTVFTDRLRKYEAGLTKLGTMRREYVENQKSKTPDIKITKEYHDAMERLQKEGDQLHKIAKNYQTIISKWTIAYMKDKVANDAVKSAIIPRNQIELFTNVDTHEYFKVIKPPRPIRPDKPPPIPPRPGQQRPRSGSTPIYSNDPNYN